MRQLVNSAFSKFGINSSRTKNITKHVLLSFLYKGGSIVCNFLLVPLTINYLDTENYGVWLTLSSFIAWFSFFDIGLGNGLRNKFAEAKAKGDMRLARAYVSSAYFTVGAICLLLIALFVVSNFFVDWTSVFNTKAELKTEMSILMPVVFGFFCLQLVVKLITTIYTADQNHSTQGRINFYTQVASLVIIWLLTKTTDSTLLIFGTVYSALPVLILVIYNLVAFSGRYRDVRPQPALWKRKYLNEIFGLGILFFFVQISGIILYSTDNFLISNLFSPADVVPYNLAYKYFSIVTMFFSIIAAPYWSSITDAFHKNDFVWIGRSMRNLNKLTLLFCGFLLLMFVFAEPFYYLWVGTKVTVPMSLNIVMALFFMLSLVIIPYTTFLNGTGKIRMQALQAFIAAVLNIPLAIIFVKVGHLGVEGVIIATVICFIPSIIFSPIQYRRIILRKANGIWNK